MAGKFHHKPVAYEYARAPVLPIKQLANLFAAEEIRRSGRATKGQHTKNAEESEKAPKKKGKGGRKSKAEAEPEPEEEVTIIRCICGYEEEDENDTSPMICCDSCSAWQHNVCMGMPTDEDDCPDQYYCEQCHPEDHKELLDGIARGEKPWLARQAEHEREEEEAKAKKRKGGKRGRKSKAELEAGNSNNGSAVNTPAKSQTPAAEVKPEVKPETGKRKASDLAVDTVAAEKVRLISITTNVY